MHLVLEIQNTILIAASLALFAIEGWALVDAVSQRADAFEVAGKQSKKVWLVILGVALAAHLVIFHPIHLLNMAGAVASLVYLVDVRPAVRALTRR